MSQQAPIRAHPRVALPTQQEMFLRTKGKTPQQGRPMKRQGRAYNLTLEEAEVADGVISSTILVQSILAHALYDSGATYLLFLQTLFLDSIFLVMIWLTPVT